MSDPVSERGYTAISDHALIGNLRTAALVSLDGSIESYCVPNFDSPSIFARILDKDKGGHFSITPKVPFGTKQSYLPSSNVLQTKFLNDQGVAAVTDFLPRQPSSASTKPLLHWLIRRVEVIRGVVPIRVEVAPAFDYARAKHETFTVFDDSVAPPDSPNSTHQKKIVFESDNLAMDLRFVAESTIENVPVPDIRLQILDLTGPTADGSRRHLGLSASCDMELLEGQVVTFVLRTIDKKQVESDKKLATKSDRENDNSKAYPSASKADQMGVEYDRLMLGASNLRAKDDPLLCGTLLHGLFTATNNYWTSWIRRSTYSGSWKEAVNRSALALKLLIFEPTGAVVASPTFSLPEFIGGSRNWDYRASWIRDSSFTLYALLRLGFTHEANAYLEFIFERLKDKNPDGSLQIMYTIHGERIFPEEELNHLDGHKSSKPVRIGNGAIDHIQLARHLWRAVGVVTLNISTTDPRTVWIVSTSVRSMGDLYHTIHGSPSVNSSTTSSRSTTILIFRYGAYASREVRNKQRNFTYSKVMLWVAIDRGLRLADKRSLPCPNRSEWLAARDDLYEQIMVKAWNPDRKIFGQSYEDTDVLDSSVMIMPLVFFMNASDPRFLSTLKEVLKSPERGGLTSNSLVYRYDVSKSDDGVGGEEGTFCLCTLWAIEALTRAGEYEPGMLSKAVTMFEDFLQFTNHVGLCTEEISTSGEGLGNAVQGFTHVTLISAAYNLSRTMEKFKL